MNPLFADRIGANTPPTDPTEERRRKLEAQLQAMSRSFAPEATRVDPDPRGGSDPLLSILRFGAEVAPGTGELLSAADAKQQFDEGNYGMAALSGLGAIPGFGMMGRVAKQGGKAVAKATARAADAAPVADLAARIRQLAGLQDELDSGVRLNIDRAALSQVPDVPQVPITDRPRPARAKTTEGLPELIRANRKRAEEYLKRGMDTGGLDWYNLDPIRRGYIDELGPEVGAQEFERFTQLVAANSPRAKVGQNIRRGSAMAMLGRQGIQVPDDQALLNLLAPALGHMAHKTAHLPAVRDIERLGTLASDPATIIRRPKTGSFGENLRGNYAPVTVDAHNARGWGVPENRIEAAYEMLEKEQQELAAKYGIAPAQVQSSIWMGGAENTGVADARPFVDVFSDVLEKAAKRNKLPADIAFQRFLRGTMPLGLAGMAAGSAAIRQNDQ
jgi:hypothetical protein